MKPTIEPVHVASAVVAAVVAHPVLRARQVRPAVVLGIAAYVGAYRLLRAATR